MKSLYKTTMGILHRDLFYLGLLGRLRETVKRRKNMQVKLTQANATVVQMWADLNGVGYSELMNKIVGEACIHFLDGMKASIRELKDKQPEDDS